MDKEELEIASRKYCELAGVDPDGIVAHAPDEGGLDTVLYSPRWERIANKIEYHDMIEKSIQYARDTKILVDPANKEDEIHKLRAKLFEIGVCPDCFEEISHHLDEPFSSCSCGTGEDTGDPPLIQQLRKAARKAETVDQCY